MPLSEDADRHALYFCLGERGLQLREVGRRKVVFTRSVAEPVDQVTAPVLQDWRCGEGTIEFGLLDILVVSEKFQIRPDFALILW